MKRADAITAIQQAIRKLNSEKPAEVTGAGCLFLVKHSVSTPKITPQPRDPEFEFEGWRFYTKTELWEDEATDDGDANIIAPDGTVFGLGWTAGAPLKYEFDFTPSFGPMLYVWVPSSIRTWDELRQQMLLLVPAMDSDLKSRARV